MKADSIPDVSHPDVSHLVVLGLGFFQLESSEFH